MAGMEFEYDEKGGTFYYFLLSFLALILVPATYYLWPRSEPKDDAEKRRKQCQCEGCQLKKQRLSSKQPWKNFKKRAIKLGIVLGWVVIIYLAYKTSQVELDYSEFDPYQELGVDREATTREIKKAYRALSLIYHPDKETGDATKFLRITKAHQALTDATSKENWEKYGNPDGPGATHFGIALPKWIVEKENSVWVLALYGLVFMVILPVVVGMWWYRSIKYSPEQILMDTTHLYFYFLSKTPNMMLKRVIMILGGSMEFERRHNSEVVERPSDNEEIPLLMRDLPGLNEKNKEKPLCFPYSVKSRALLHAHLSRLGLPPKTLELDKQYVLQKSPYLLNEMINILAQLVAMAHAGRVSRQPRLDTIENVMKLSQMVVQALWDNKSPLLQLPHVTEDMLRHFVTKRRNIRSLRQLAKTKEDERRGLLRSLSDDEYHNLMCVLSSMPYVDINARIEVMGDDEDKSTVTAGSIVTVTVILDRYNLESQMNTEDVAAITQPQLEEGEAEKGSEDGEEEQQTQAVEPAAQKKPKVWEKKKKKGKGKPQKKKPAKPVVQVKKVTTLTSSAVVSKKDDASSEPNGSIPKPRRSSRSSDADDISADEESLSGNESESETPSAGGDNQPLDDEDDWQKFQEESKKDTMLETKSKETHLVHCPYFPLAKYEWWWLYLADRKRHMLITAPVQVCSLKTHEEVQLKFSAPPKPGLYQYTVFLRSDSYIEFDVFHNIKLDVKEARKVESHPQWEMSDDEDKEDEDGTETEDSTDYEDTDDE